MPKFEAPLPEERPENPVEKGEHVEPQVEKASEILEGKGYEIGTLAGEAGMIEREKKQAIVFHWPRKQPDKNPFDDSAMEKLRALGVQIFSGALPMDMIGLEFQTEGMNEAEIERRWIEIAEVLPYLK